MPKDDRPKILMTGGHASSTAYAVIAQIKKQGKNWELFFIGGGSSIEGKNTKTLHSVSLKEVEVQYYNITTGRLQRRLTRRTLPSLLKIPIGLIQSLYLLLRLDPDVVLSFGGYAAFPVVIVSWLFGKKIIIHEQTAAAGRANIFTARLADKIALSRATSSKYFPRDKIVMTGNPISLKVVELRPKTSRSDRPVIFVTGGASGSKTINENIEAILEKLLDKYIVVHQTGDLQFDKFKKTKQKLPEDLRGRYEVYGVIPSAKWPSFLGRSDVIVSRSGANIVSEIVQIKRPAVLIPLPIAYLDEQYKNALIAKDLGLVKILKQQDLDPGKLFGYIREIVDNWGKYYKNAKDHRSPDKDADKKMVNLVEGFL